MTPEQCRQARKLLGWSTIRLSIMAKLGVHVVTIFERTGRMQEPLSLRPQVNRLALIRTTFEASGVEFIEEDDGGPGVRMRKDGV